MTLDILKAFDKVWQAGFHHKFKDYGVSGQIFDCILLFLTNHALKIMLNSNASKSFYINAGVTHGFILGLALFLILINDFFDIINSQLSICAMTQLFTLFLIVSPTK